MPRQIDPITAQEIKEIATMANDARAMYSDTIEQTTVNGGALKTIRVPLAMLANIRELADALNLRT